MVDFDTIKYAEDGTAWKTSTMRGYVKKVVPSGAAEGAFNLVFMDADGSGAEAFPFSYDPTTNMFTQVTGAPELVLDGELLGHLLTNVWDSAPVGDYEKVRSPGNRRW